MKFILIAILSAITLQSYSQTAPGFGQAKQQLMNHKSDLKDFLSLYGFSSIDEFEISQIDEPYTSYSYDANNTLYRYIWSPDVITYSFLGKAPKTEEGQYEFRLLVSFSRSTFDNGYGELTANYHYYTIGAAVESYTGGKLNDAVLERCLFSYADFQSQSLSTGTKFKFTRVDSLIYKKNEDYTSSTHKTSQEYFVTVIGEGVHEWGEYEYTEVADLEMEYILTIDMVNGQWDGTGIYKKGDAKVTNKRVNPNYPPCNPAMNVGFKEVYKKYSVVDLPMDSYRYLMDMCRLIESEYKRSKEEFIEISALKKLFSGTEGQTALDRIYQLKTVIEKYHLNVEKLEVKPTYGRGVKTDKTNTIKVYFTLNRDLSKDEWKAIKASGASKDVLNVLKYPAKGAMYTVFELKNDGSDLSVVSSYITTEVKMKTGEYSTKKHPLD